VQAGLCLFEGLKHRADFAQHAAMHDGFAPPGASLRMHRRRSFNPNSGLTPAASAFAKQWLANSPQCSAAGVIFA